MIFDIVKKNLQERGYQVSCFENADQAVEYLDGQIRGKTVGFGGSMTLEQMGLYPKLVVQNRVSWHWKPAQEQTTEEICRQASSAQIYISSVNGIAETGEIVNIDGACNRISAMLYGHENVYLVAGINKLAKDYDSALFRARNVAAPKNARRLARKTPCALQSERCYDCKSPDRICRALSVLWAKPSSGVYEVVLINEELGF